MLLNTAVYNNVCFLIKAEMVKKTLYRVEIHPELDEHFYNLKSYVQFPLLSVMCFSSLFSFQIYAALLSRFNLAEYITKIAGNSVKGYTESFSYKPDMITKMLKLTQSSYKNYKNLNSAVIKKAVNDINSFSDLQVCYSGNNNEITFTIRKKTSNEQILSYSKILEKLAS